MAAIRSSLSQSNIWKSGGWRPPSARGPPPEDAWSPPQNRGGMVRLEPIIASASRVRSPPEGAHGRDPSAVQRTENVQHLERLHEGFQGVDSRHAEAVEEIAHEGVGSRE